MVNENQLEKAWAKLIRNSSGWPIYIPNPNPKFKGDTLLLGYIHRLIINGLKVWYCVDVEKVEGLDGFTRTIPVRIKRICY